jgi:hypothetical protein
MFYLRRVGRLWCLKFHAARDKHTGALGQWAISLSIIAPSPPTWLDSRIIILEPRRKPSAILPPWPLPKGSAMGSLLSASNPDARREKPPIQFRLQTGTHQLQPPTSSKLKAGRTELVACFSESAASSGLQYPYDVSLLSNAVVAHTRDCFSDSAYYSADGSLQVTMEARLEKPVVDTGCIIS